MSKDANSAVKSLLRQHNRPFNATEITGLLDKKFTKGVVQKSLDSLSESGSVVEKLYGKQKIYYINQDAMPSCDLAELSKMDEEIDALKEQLATDSHAKSELEQNLRRLKSAVSVDEANEEIAALEKETTELEKRIAAAREASGNMDPAEKERIESDYTKYTREWRRRRKMFNEMAAQILEQWPKSKESFYEEVGVETDEAAGVTLP